MIKSLNDLTATWGLWDILWQQMLLSCSNRAAVQLKAGHCGPTGSESYRSHMSSVCWTNGIISQTAGTHGISYIKTSTFVICFKSFELFNGSLFPSCVQLCDTDRRTTIEGPSAACELAATQIPNLVSTAAS